MPCSAELVAKMRINGRNEEEKEARISLHSTRLKREDNCGGDIAGARVVHTYSSFL